MSDGWGRAWIFGDDIDTDALAPGAFIKRPIEDLASHCLESVDPKFAAGVAKGDVLVAGKNFGMGSSREQAAEALKVLGLAAVVAESFAGIFYRNALNLGLPVLVLPKDQRFGIKAGSKIHVNPVTGHVDIQPLGGVGMCEPIPPALLEMVQAGGLVAQLEQRFRETKP